MGKRKFSTAFDRDFKWFLKMRHKFNFDGVAEYYDKKGNPMIQYDPNGVTGKLEDRLRDTNQAIIDVDKHKDSFDKLRVAHRLNSEALSNKSPQGK